MEKTGPETLITVAKKFAGSAVDGQSTLVPTSLTWQTLAQFNYGTDDPAELNWYLENFNGCSTKNASGDFMPDARDRCPFIYIPTVSLTACSHVVVRASGTSTIHLPPRQSDFCRTALARYDDIDATKKGFLQKCDIDKLLLSRDFTGTHGAMLATLRTEFEALEKFSDDEWGRETGGITRADLVALDRLLATTPTGDANAVINVYEYGKSKIAIAGSSLYATSPIQLRKIAQARVGDCWFLAALVALGGRADAIVRKMIQDHGKKFVVTFAGAPSSPVTVLWPNDAQTALLASSSGNGLWLTVIEMALGSQMDGRDPIDGVDAGNTDGGAGIPLLTGNTINEYDLWLRRGASVRSDIQDALRKKKAVVTSIGQHIWESDDSTRNGWPTAHCYSILAFDPVSDKVTVRNPWGHEPDGVQVTMDDYFENWTDVACEQ